MNKSNIIIISVVALLVIVVGVYFYNTGGQLPSGGSLLSAPTQDSDIGVAELALLQRIKSIKIDTKFFSSIAFTSLTDYTQVIPRQDVGRSDPFASIPGVPSPFTSPADALKEAMAATSSIIRRK